jgi:predicted DNA-binding transcriptional regulator AlpA
VKSRYDHLPPGLLPIFLRRQAASAFFDVSETTFDKMVEQGLVPRPVRVGSISLWFRPALVSAAAKMTGTDLQYSAQAETQEAPNEWDAIVGK